MSTDQIWIKSSYSGSSGDNCVEIAIHPHSVQVRDSKGLERPALTVSPTAWSAFAARSANLRARD
ncbi:DUF397 domain-containing protein [Streptomyces zingiberis]|uniref:DUF397 domain-containing protein n=1 Tax=Streptomyces zingiberis TaxID=2053010 RepID=A0ABX1C2U2_9ACTN|nr:DUF397 domain-containing protein [Streptomyces zingiberis]NJQ02440.1 DUF397 domain-containing protein [Streptomyces zingiberis]